MIASIDYSLLFPITTDPGAPNLLSTLYGATGNVRSSATSALAALQNAEKNQAKLVSATANQPEIARDIAAFRKVLATAKSPGDLLDNPMARKVLLTANGLGSYVDSAALAKQALLSDTSDSKSLANRLTDTRWKSVAQTYAFATKGLAVLQDPGTQATLANAYAEVKWRESLDATTPGLSNALTFRAGVADIASVDQILGDPILRDVVTTALGIPREIALQELPAQERAISTRLDIGKLKDKHFVESFTQQYLMKKAEQAAGTGTQASLDQLALKATGLVV
jgi:hypothetical protein